MPTDYAGGGPTATGIANASTLPQVADSQWWTPLAVRSWADPQRGGGAPIFRDRRKIPQLSNRVICLVGAFCVASLCAAARFRLLTGDLRSLAMFNRFGARAGPGTAVAALLGVSRALWFRRALGGGISL